MSMSWLWFGCGCGCGLFVVILQQILQQIVFARARALLSYVERELECPVCMNLFDSSATIFMPHNLPCGHSVCLSCLSDVLDQDRECPLCREPFDDYSEEVDFPKSFALVSVVSVLAARTRLSARDETTLDTRNRTFNTGMQGLAVWFPFGCFVVLALAVFLQQRKSLCSFVGDRLDAAWVC